MFPVFFVPTKDLSSDFKLVYKNTIITLVNAKFQMMYPFQRF